ncbi:hypothetical protein LguiA_026212 [Lonicera macranthoides]
MNKEIEREAKENRWGHVVSSIKELIHSAKATNNGGGGGGREMSERKKKAEKKEDEVGELLRAAEDSMLLKLRINSHMSRGSSSTIINPDLDRRFQALRSKPNLTTSSKSHLNPELPNPPPSISSVSTNLNLNSDYNPQGVDLFARFTALKSSIPAHSSSPSLNELQKKFENGDDEEDKVKKLIRWVVDAAHLDHSLPSDSNGEDDIDQSVDEDRVDRKKKKGKQK